MAWGSWLKMPGKSHAGPLAPLDADGLVLRRALESEVQVLASEIGERNVGTPAGLAKAARHVEAALARSGRAVGVQSYLVGGVECTNFEVELRGSKTPDEIVLVGAHYDSAPGTPGADDNASGSAALLQLALRLSALPRPPARTLRFVAFVNEEPPYFQTADMGSLRYARRCRERGEKIVAMLSLETIGYFSDAEGSQQYPPPLGLFYPTRGDFIGFVGNPGSKELVRQAVGVFRDKARFPSQGAAVPGALPGVGWSDHWAFWQEGYPAIMVTDTAPFRNPNYHRAGDTPDRMDFERMTRVVLGVEQVLLALAG
ncbi:MAG: M28 family peptidase [Myxococcales bacterium]|nr:M28 family peptidase [Myxococcales bacterium]